MLQQFKHHRPRMNLFPLTHSMIGALLLMAVSAPATGAVTQCIDETGMVTFTDQPCAGDTRTVDGAAVPDQPPVKAKVISTITSYSATEEARRVAWAMPRAPRRSLELDVSTLKAARLSMVADDLARRLARQQAAMRSKL